MAGILAISVAPAFADHDHHDNRDNEDHWNNNRNINVRVNDDRFEHSNRYHNKHYRQYQTANNDWNDRDWSGQRTLYRNNWNRVSHEQQQQIDAQMRAQWLAYHHNNYNGDYTWNQYSDPRFLDYVHRSNPSLLNTLRNYVGF